MYIITVKGKEVSRHEKEQDARSEFSRLRTKHGMDVKVRKESESKITEVSDITQYWKDIAKNSTRLNSPVQEYKTFFSCGYRGDNTIGPGTNIPHNYTPPPVVVVPPSVPKNDHVWDINLCFLAGTMVTMEDGSKKAIEKIDLGESVKIGGRIFAQCRPICPGR